MDEIALTKAEARGSKAQQLLDNELLKESFEALKQEYIDYWMATHINDDIGRQRLWQAVQIVGKVRDHLAKVASGGRMATKELSSIKTLKR